MSLSEFEQKVLDELRAIATNQARLEERLNHISKRLDAQHGASKTHESRLDELERWRIRITALAAGVAGAVSFLANWLMKKIGIH